MKYLLPAAAVAVALLAGCDRPATHSSTTVVKEPSVVQKETVVQRDVPAPSTNVTIEAKPSESKTEETKSTTTSTVDTPMGSATKTETTKTETTKQ
jgi:hypothetical protein